jgi:hypothetical protein
MAVSEMVRGKERLQRLPTIFSRRDGTIVGVNKRRIYEAPFFLCTNPPYNDVTIGSAAQSSQAVGMHVSAEGPMQISKLGAVFDSQHKSALVTMTMQDGQNTMQLSNAPIHNRTIFGPGGQMYPLRESLYLDENRGLGVVFFDKSTAVVVSKARDTNVVTLTFSEPHAFSIGDNVVVALSPADATMDGARAVTATPTLNQITFTANGVDVVTTTTGGTVTPAAGFTNKSRIVGAGAKYAKLQQDPTLARIKDRLREQQYLTHPYWYVMDNVVATLSALQYNSYDIVINAEHNFELHQISIYSTDRFNINVVETTNGESLVNAPSGTNYGVPDRLLCGDASYPFLLREPFMVFGTQRLQLQLWNTSQNVNSIYVTLGGVAVKVRDWR